MSNKKANQVSKDDQERDELRRARAAARAEDDALNMLLRRTKQERPLQLRGQTYQQYADALVAYGD